MGLESRRTEGNSSKRRERHLSVSLGGELPRNKRENVISWLLLQADPLGESPRAGRQIWPHLGIMTTRGDQRTTCSADLLTCSVSLEGKQL